MVKKIEKIKEESKKEPTELSATEVKEVRIIERVIENREIVSHDAFGKLNRSQVELIKRTYARGATDDELKLFITACHALQVSPFSKQVHLVPRWDSKLGQEVRAIQVGIDGLRATAEKTGKYAGNDDPIFDNENEIEVEIGKQKKKITVPEKATVTVWKIVEGGRYAFTATARWKEYYPGPKQGFQWHQKPFLMLSKCSEALALRKGFPSLLAGIYTPEEMDRTAEVDTEAKKAQHGFTTLMSGMDTLTVEELEDYRMKIVASTKYTDAQKKQFTDAATKRIDELKSIGTTTTAPAK